MVATRKSNTDQSQRTVHSQSRSSLTSKRGFASMDKNKVQEIARKGGEARKEQLGPEGYAKMGHKGGETRAQQLGSEGYAEMGRKGGQHSHRNSAATSQKQSKGASKNASFSKTTR